MRLKQQNLLKFLGFNTQGDLGPWTFYTDKRKNLVFFIKAPPTTGPTWLQKHQRATFQVIAELWQLQTRANRDNWELATIKLRLNLTGYNLFTWYHTVGHRPTLATIERLANLTLIND